MSKCNPDNVDTHGSLLNSGNIVSHSKEIRYIYGLDENDNIVGSDEDDEIYGRGGNDFLCGKNGNDVLDGGAGDDILSGGDGNDILYGGLGNDVLYGGDGEDILHSGFGSNVLRGGDGNDKLYAGSGNNRLEGSEGNDTLHSGAGSNTFVYSFKYQSLDPDTLTVESIDGFSRSIDTVKTVSGFDHDTIIGFKVKNNQIEKSQDENQLVFQTNSGLSATLAQKSNYDIIEIRSSVFKNFDDLKGYMYQIVEGDVSGTTVDFNDSNTILFKDIILTDLHADNFVFIA